MSRRLLVCVGAVAALALGPMRVAGQTWSPSRTPDGQPDLQGVWVSNTATPLERPKALEGRQFLTDQEVAELKKRADRIFNQTDSDFGAGDAVFLAALANVEQFHSAGSTSNSDGMIERVFENCTSQIVDPPDGKIPPLVPGARQKPSFANAALAAGLRPVARPEELSNALRCITFGVPRLGRLNLHLVERFTRVGPDTINYEITLDDSTTWTKPCTGMPPLKLTQEAIYEYDVP